VIKLLTDIGVEDEAAGAAALTYFDGLGAVRLLEHDHRAHLLEYAECPDLVSMVEGGDDERATLTIAVVLNALHERRDKPPPSGLKTLRERFQSLFARAASPSPDPIYVKAARLAEELLASEQAPQVLHGDMHHGNVRHCEGRGWLAIDPKGLYGERTFDAANVLLNPNKSAIVLDERRIVRTLDILASELSLDRTRLAGFVFAYCCLSACWSVEDGDDPTLALAVARAAEREL
jgi:streptomycin 6-kinase